MTQLPPTAVPRAVSQAEADTLHRLADTVQQMDDQAREEGRELVELPADTQRIREVNAFTSQWQQR